DALPIVTGVGGFTGNVEDVVGELESHSQGVTGPGQYSGRFRVDLAEDAAELGGRGDEGSRFVADDLEVVLQGVGSLLRAGSFLHLALDQTGEGLVLQADCLGA